MNLFRSRVDVFEAINRCEWQKVKDAVVPGKANLRDQQYDATLLHWAVNEGHVPTVEHLLTCGADVRLRDGKHSATPLHWAAAKGHAFVVRLLMMQESDVNSRDASNRTPLHWAAGNGQLGVIRELLFWGARVECTDAWKKVPLHWAAFRGHVASVEELVGKGSPIDKPDSDGHVPGETFHQSVPEETRKAIRTALKGGPASGDSVVRAATDSSELLLETLHGCRSWGELFENRHFDVLSKECQEHRERLRGVIQGIADQGKPERLEPCLKAMDLLNSALGLHEDMRSGTKPVPLKGGGDGQRGRNGGSRGGGIGDQQDSGGSGLPRAGGGENRGSEDLRDFLSPGEGAPPGENDGGGGGGGGGASSAASLRLYQLATVKEACGGFDPKRCIGEGGFGKVYRGSMMGLPVAVKKLDETGLQGREEFFREVEVLSTCRHENIVPLLGVCMEPPCLVYRLMPNNSLQHHLDDPALRQRLGWRLRVRTTLHMCSGLEYLHSESTNKPKVIHGDIKPENILLDEYLKARLSDFGISRVGESEAGVPRSRGGGRGGRGAGPGADDAAALQGTFGYMDPVYQSTGRLDERSDVFSLGVVMLVLLTGDPVYSPDKQPPGLVDRVRKAIEDRMLKAVVDRAAVWNKAAAKAYARLSIGCCEENPGKRPSLREVSETVRGILEAGQKPSNVSPAAEAAGAVRSAGSGAGAGSGVGVRAGGVESLSAASVHESPGDDLLQLFDHVNISTKSIGRNNGERTGGDGDGDGVAVISRKPAHQCPSDQHRPTSPPPPYESVIKDSITMSPPPPYHSAGMETKCPLVSLEDDAAAAAGGEADAGGEAVASTGDDEAVAELLPLGGTSGEGGERWWEDKAGPRRAQHVQQAARNVGSVGAVDRRRAASASGASGDPRSLAVPLSGAAVTVGIGSGGSKNASISCTRSVSLAEYGVTLPGVLKAAKGGGVLSSNPRLLCVCCADVEVGVDTAAREAGGTAAGRSSPLPLVGNAASDGVVRDPGHVSVLDLWHRGRTVRYPVAADRAAMSPNQSESVIAVLGGGSLHVFSIPRRCRLQEQAVATELCLWRWLSPWGLALVTDIAVFYWSVSDSHAGGNSPDRDMRRESGGRSGGDRDSVGEAHDRESVTRFRRPRTAFARRRTRTSPNTLHRVYDYQASADGRWGMLLCAVVDDDWGGGVDGGRGNGYGSHSSSIKGGGGPVRVDLQSFELKTTFEFEVLGASLLTMPGSNPPLNLLALVVRGEAGATELRVLDLDRSLALTEGPEARERLAEHGEGWLIAATHVIADADLRGSSACRVVTGKGEVGNAESPPATSLVSPPVFLRQWTENTNVLFVVGCHGLLLLLDVVTGAELARAQACVPPVVEAEVDPDVGDLVVVSTADGGGVHRLTVRAEALRESVEYQHKDAEMATRVSVLTGYGAGRPLLPPRRQG